MRIQEFFCQGEGGPGSSTYFKVYRGGPMVLLQIFQGGSNYFQGGPNANLYRTHITITCDFPGGVGGGLDPLSPSRSPNVQCGILAE